MEQLKILKGNFIDFVHLNNITHVKYSVDSCSYKEEFFDVVINCAGSRGLTDSVMSPLLRQLCNSGLCPPTQSKQGLVVGNNFEITDGFYVNGPLLAGNVVNGMGIWHVEHCGRIISFAKQIARHLIATHAKSA